MVSLCWTARCGSEACTSRLQPQGKEAVVVRAGSLPPIRLRIFSLKTLEVLPLAVSSLLHLSEDPAPSPSVDVTDGGRGGSVPGSRSAL